MKHQPSRPLPTAAVARLGRTFAVCLCLGLTLAACSDDPQDPPAPAPDNNDPNNDNNDLPPLEGELGLQVGDEAARACEVMFDDPAGALVALRTDDSVEGRILRQGDKLALAFAQASDVAVAPGAVRLAVSGAQDGVQIASVTCFDRAGAVIGEPGVELLSAP